MNGAKEAKMIHRQLAITWLLGAVIAAGAPTTTPEMVLNAQLSVLKLNVREGRSDIRDIALLRATLQEHDLFDFAIEPLEQLVYEYGSMDPALYFLLLESPKTNEVRTALIEDLEGFKPASRDQSLSLDFLKLYFAIPGASAVTREETRDSPIAAKIEVQERGERTFAIITLENQGDKGRFLMISSDAMDYLGLERIDKVVVPLAHRKSPVIPVWFGPGERMVRLCSLQSVTKTRFSQHWRWEKYPFDDPPKGYGGDASTILWWKDDPHVELQGDLIGFGTEPIPVYLFACYDEERLFSRIAANNFDPTRMPWTRRASANTFYRKMEKEGVLIPEEKRGWKRDWYNEFIVTTSDKVEWSLGGPVNRNLNHRDSH
jgi:hypothetical protein